MRASAKVIVRLALLCGVAAAAGACGKDGQQTQITGPSPTVRSIELLGPTAIEQPGGTAQLNAIATYSDGSSKNVTLEANWMASSDPAPQAIAVSVSRGLVAAQRYGTARVTVRYGGATASVSVRVAPPGAFLVFGNVTAGNGGFAVPDAAVTVSAPAGGPTVLTDRSGSFALPAAGEVVLRASKDGYEARELPLGVTGDRWVRIDLALAAGTDSIRGVYTLTVTASPSCSLPASARTRTYTAQVEEGRLVGRPEGLLVSLSGAEFLGWTAPGFTGAVNGTTVTFTIVDDAWGDVDFSMVEVIDARTALAYAGTATGSITPNLIVATLDGSVSLWPMVPGTPGTTCAARDHQLRLVR
jgi:hypothetical protein